MVVNFFASLVADDSKRISLKEIICDEFIVVDKSAKKAESNYAKVSSYFLTNVEELEGLYKGYDVVTESKVEILRTDKHLISRRPNIKVVIDTQDLTEFKKRTSDEKNFETIHSISYYSIPERSVLHRLDRTIHDEDIAGFRDLTKCNEHFVTSKVIKK